MERLVDGAGPAVFQEPVPIGWSEYSYVSTPGSIPVTYYWNISRSTEMERFVDGAGPAVFQEPVPIGWPEYAYVCYTGSIPVANYGGIPRFSEMERKSRNNYSCFVGFQEPVPIRWTEYPYVSRFISRWGSGYINIIALEHRVGPTGICDREVYAF